jgi:hypothetical protein
MHLGGKILGVNFLLNLQYSQNFIGFYGLLHLKWHFSYVSIAFWDMGFDYYNFKKSY